MSRTRHGTAHAAHVLEIATLVVVLGSGWSCAPRDTAPATDVAADATPGCAGHAGEDDWTDANRHRADANRKGPAGRKADPGGCLLRRADGPGTREFPDLGNSDQSLPRVRRSLGHREAGGGAGEHRRRRDEEGQAGGHREGGAGRAQRQIPRSVPGRLVPGRRRHVDQHERQRSAGQHRAGTDRTQEGRVLDRRAARRPEHVAVDERLVPDGDQGGVHPAQRQADRESCRSWPIRFARRATSTSTC